MKLKRTLQALAVAAGAASACDSTKPKDELTMSQSLAILRELWILTERGYPGNTVPCPVGDSATVVFAENYRQRGDTTLVTSIATVTLDGCELSADGDTLVLEGDPSVVFDFEGWSIEPDDPYEEIDNEYDIEIVGAVTWSTNDGISNRCQVNLTMEEGHIGEDNGKIDGDLTGLLCGRDVSLHFSEIDYRFAG